jgi:hypothetical protein
MKLYNLNSYWKVSKIILQHNVSVLVKQKTEFRAVVMLETMLSGSPVITAWRVLRLRMEETASRYGG